MKHRSFFWFVLPSALAMLLFIAAPIASVIIQSFYKQHEQVIVEVESCGPFGCTTETSIDQEATRELRESQPMGQFAGFEIYTNRGHLAFNEIEDLWQARSSLGNFFDELLNLPLYGALAFTLTYTFIVTPAALILGLIIALSVNSIPRIFRGPTIFFSLLPMIVTPLVGALILFWMVDARGIIGTFIQELMADPNLSLKASTGLTWLMLMVYGIWNTAPFAFVVYYAGLQTVPQDVIESALIDGASPWERLYHVILPHLFPLTAFMALIKIMDNFRIFEPIISFNAEAHAQSLSYFIFDDLGGETRLLNSAAATSVLTIIGVIILLSPILVRTYQRFGKV